MLIRSVSSPVVELLLQYQKTPKNLKLSAGSVVMLKVKCLKTIATVHGRASLRLLSRRWTAVK